MVNVGYGRPRDAQRCTDVADLARGNTCGKKNAQPVLGFACGEDRLQLGDEGLAIANARVVRSIALVRGEVGALERLAKLREEAVVGWRDCQPPISGAESLIRDDARMRVAVAPWLLSRRKCARGNVDQRSEGAREEGDLDQLALAVALSTVRAARIAAAALSPARISTTATPTFIGSPSGSPVIDIRPLSAWTVKSYPGRSCGRQGPEPLIVQ